MATLALFKLMILVVVDALPVNHAANVKVIVTRMPIAKGH